jgi:molybdenum cofactor cytidylyltransferase
VLWDAPRRLFVGMPMPADLDRLNRALDTGFAELTGTVSTTFWRETGFPLIRDHWEAVR